ncbi:hypothetical protein JM47_01575 [Ureaplasma diversum]|uniref:Dihydroxyacetone-related kinase n=2 Tax=Ureaplasma diversum TaxID=42094 RepID=A0A084EXH5_9BACT|nr:DAK2 domain-containing protein [Ureaplasma diversum]AJQ45296.1 hypothetical protein JM47_01575 [Ureaplasma diversum]KEZ22667.1 Dihydroxyacetone-related kinase [Ureaplasma diversum NCTC 246]
MKTIKLEMFKQMLIAGSKALELESDYINNLNVFPVPDGDTGSNMKTTANGAISSILNDTINNFAILAKTYSRGLLMNARGNSGVILSQIFRGFFEKLATDSQEVSIQEIQAAFVNAKEHAYNSVSTPIEGTILTIIRVISEEIVNEEFETANELFDFAVAIGQDTLEKTPDMLPALKEAGVVDSGGYGLVCLLKGMSDQLSGRFDESVLVSNKNSNKAADLNNFIGFNNEPEEGFGYCSEIIMSLNKKITPDAPEKHYFNIESYKRELSKFGDSMVVVQDDDLVKVHIHTTRPHKLLQVSQKYGEFDKVKFENMTNQFYENLQRRGINYKEYNSETKREFKQKIVVTVPSSKFKKRILSEYGIEQVIVTEEDGTPSIQDFVNKINQANATHVIIITDDSNLVLAAEQATKIVAENGVIASVVAGNNAFQALLAISYFDERSEFKANVKSMNKAIKKSHSALVSTAAKSVNYTHITVTEGESISIINKQVVASNKEEFSVLKRTIDLLISVSKHKAICYIFYGINANLEDVKQIEKYVSEKYGLICDIEFTGQKLYQYYIGVQ